VLFRAYALIGIAQQIGIAPPGKSFPSKLDRRRATRRRRTIAIRFEPARQGLSATSSESVLGNNSKQVAADELRGFHCLRRSEPNDSGVIHARCADTRWRNEELFADILRQRGGRHRSIRHVWRHGTSMKAVGLFPGSELGQNNREKNIALNQLLTWRAQSHLRVICATPF
jgi:hypothetical protein